MCDECCAAPQAGSSVCGQPLTLERPKREKRPCPQCGRPAKPVEGQTVRSMVAVSLRDVPQGNYLFCPTRECPLVYFSEDGRALFLTSQVRERVYQKEPDSRDVWMCYCFRHNVGDVTLGTSLDHEHILADINRGIKAEECACDLRNPQGSCCLGNINARIKQRVSASPPISPFT